MTFRVTSNTFSSQAIRFSALHSRQIAVFQQQISSGLKIQRASEDPTTFRRITATRADLLEFQADQSSVSTSRATLSDSVVQLTDINTLITKARNLAQQGIQAFDKNERDALALEAESVLARVENLALAVHDGNYLYGGTKIDSPPFEFLEPETLGGPLKVNYLGSDQNSRAFVGEAITVDTYYAGAAIFGNPQRSETIVYGTTGAAIGSGTDTLVSNATLTVSHDETIYSGLSGVAPGTNSVNGDTVIGPSGLHNLTIDDKSGTGARGSVSLNGGPEVEFTSSDTNLRIEGPTGEVVYIDTTSIAAGFVGTVPVTANGSLSVDGGLTTVPIDFSADQVVTDSANGKFVTIDSTSISSAGDDYLEFPGTADLFQILHQLASDLRNDRDLQNEHRADALDRRLGELILMSDHVLGFVGEQSTSLQTLEGLEQRIDELSFQAESRLVEMQATDIPEAVLRMENSLALLEYTFSVTATVSSLQLIDFLR